MIGRYISADGYVSTGQEINGYNMFAYCGNNPVNRTDSSGTKWWSSVKKFVKKVVKTIKKWVKKVVGGNKKYTIENVLFEKKTMLGVNSSYGMKTTTKNKSKWTPITVYNEKIYNMTSGNPKTMIGIENDFRGTDFSIGEDGFTYSKTTGGIIGETNMAFSITSELNMEVECNYTICWADTEVTTYGTISVSSSATIMGALAVARYAFGIPNMQPVLIK